jgi:biotin-(acetyl-CoA carboxylase) ligase
LISCSGIGVNISNSSPSACLNDAIDQEKSVSTLTHFTIEEFIGRTVGYFQKWVSQLSQSNIVQAVIAINNFYQFYESHWMHQ